LLKDVRNDPGFGLSQTGNGTFGRWLTQLINRQPEAGDSDVGIEPDELETDQLANRAEQDDADVAANNATPAPKQPTRENIPGLRDFDRISFSGVEAFDPVDVRQSLHADFDLVVAAHSGGSELEFCRALERTVVNGYRHQGFGDAIVDVQFNAPRQEFEVRVQEGIRYRCARVQVTGTSRVPAATLTDNHSQSSYLLDFRWRDGAFVPFDDYSAVELHRRVEWSFAKAGYLNPAFTVSIRRDAKTKTAALAIDVQGDGPRAVVGQIEISGTKRDSAAAVQKHLACETGDPYDRDLVKRLKQRLCDTARYMGIEVTAQERPISTENDQKPFDLKIELQEYAAAPSLAQEFPPAERALLKLHEWVARWSRGEIDDVVVVEVVNEPDPALPQIAPPVRARLVISPERGQIFSLDVPARNDRIPKCDLLVVALPDHITWAAPYRQTKLTIPISGDQRFEMAILGDTSRSNRRGADPYAFRLNFNWGLKCNKTPEKSPLAVIVDLAPVLLTSLAHDKALTCTLNDGVWRIVNGSAEIRIDDATGKFIEFRLTFDRTLSVSLRTASTGLSAELQKVDETLAACHAGYDAASPWKSTVEFFIEELIAIGERSELEGVCDPLRALQKLCRVWNPPGIEELFAACELPSSKPDDPFSAGYRGIWSWDHDSGHRELSRKKLVAAALRLYRAGVPETSWMWPAGRDALLYWAAQDGASAERLRELPHAADVGPIGELLVGLLDGVLNVELRRAAGNEGLNRLSSEAFARDYRPLLAGNSWLGRWVLSLARAIRELDEAELQMLVLFLPIDDPDDVIDECIGILKADAKRPVAEVLPAVLDFLWNAMLRSQVKATLTSFARPPPAQPAAARHDDQVRPANAEVE
jgi:hypothetical protein